MIGYAISYSQNYSIKKLCIKDKGKTQLVGSVVWQLGFGSFGFDTRKVLGR